MADEQPTQEQLKAQEELQKLIKEANKALADQVRLQAEVSRLTGDHVTQAEMLARQYREELRLAQELNEILNANSDKSLQMVDTYKKQLFEAQRVGNITLNNYKAQLSALEEIERIQQRRTEIADSTNESDKEELKNLHAKLESLSKFVKKQQQLSSIQSDGVKAGAGMVETLGKLIQLSPDLDQGIVGGLGRALAHGEGLTSVLGGATSSFVEMFDVGNIVSFVASNIVELTVRMDTLTTSFVQATGASRDFNSEMIETFDQTANLGIGLQDASEAFSGLFVNFTKFSTLAPQTRTQLAATAAGLEKLGVDTRTTGDGFDFLVSGLGMAVTEAESILKRFAVEGRQAGIPPQVMAQQFTALEPKLAAFGNAAPDIFIRTAKTAKSLGLEVGELGQNLFSLSEGLDTFDQAADKVASFNLVMGGSFVNAFDLTMAAAKGPFAQLEMLRDGFDAAGRSFENINFFEQKMLADSFGISIKNLRSMLEGTITPQEAMISQEEQFAAIVEDATTAVEKLSAGVEKLAKGFGMFSEFMNSGAGIFTKYVVGIGLGAMVFAKFFKSLMVTKAAIDGIGAATALSTGQTFASTNATLTKAAADEVATVASAKHRAALTADFAAMAQAEAAKMGLSISSGKATIATEIETASKAKSIPVTQAAAASNMTLAGSFKAISATMLPFLAIAGAVYSAFTIFNEISGILDGTSSSARVLGLILGGVAGAAAGIMLGNPLIAIAGFGVGVAAANAALPRPERTVNTGIARGTMGLTAGTFDTPSAEGMDMPTMPDKFMRNGGDNVTRPFVMNDGGRPSAEVMTPTSILKAQDTSNLTSTLKNTAVALTDNRKTDGTFDRMVRILEKIAGNTESQPDQRPIEVGLNIGGRQFQKEVVRAMNRAME